MRRGGFKPPRLPPHARAYAAVGKKADDDPDKDAERFRSIMEKLGVKEYEVMRLKPQDASLNYGVWLCFRK